MSNAQLTEKEVKERRARAIMALKFDTVEMGSVSYWRMLSDKEEVI